jgi:hypothetical protein
VKGPHCGDGAIQKPDEECDLGEEKNGVDGEACNGVCKLDGKVIFATSALYGGDLGGLAGADLKCNELALAAKVANAGNFMAWLSAAEGSPNDRMKKYADEAYVLLDGETVVADSWEDLTDGFLGGAIAVDETGAKIPTHSVWTATSANGEGSSPTCGDWHSASKGTYGLAGDLTSPTSTWTDDAVKECFYKARLVCVEQ